MSTLERAIQIAARAHEGQVDKAGAPYILHPLRVMLSVEGEEQRIAAILHDVLEDTSVTEQDLRAEGYSDSVLAALAHLTRLPTESYEEFIDRACQHPIARSVKLADLYDNSDITRLPEPTERDYKRLRKYQNAIARIESPQK